MNLSVSFLSADTPLVNHNFNPKQQSLHDRQQLVPLPTRERNNQDVKNPIWQLRFHAKNLQSGAAGGAVVVLLPPHSKRVQGSLLGPFCVESESSYSLMRTLSCPQGSATCSTGTVLGDGGVGPGVGRLVD